MTVQPVRCSSPLLVCTLLLTACGSQPSTALPDAGPEDAGAPDASPEDAGAPDASPVDAGSGVDVAAFCEAISTKFCNASKQCDPVGLASTDDGDLAGCVTRRAAGCLTRRSLPGQKYTQDQLDACLTATDLSTCDNFYLYLTGVDLSASCRALGDLPLNGVCTSDDQCESGHCAMPPLTFCGACATRPPGVPGGACVSPSDCDPGLACAAAHCTQPGHVGDACTVDEMCLPTLGCVMSRCAARKPDGASCTTSGECQPYQPCTGGTCAPRTLVMLGETCDAADVCEAGAKCKVVEGSAYMSVCVPRIADGAPCGEGEYWNNWASPGEHINDPCLAPFECVNGTCADPTSRSPACAGPAVLTPQPPACSTVSNPQQLAVRYENNTDRDLAMYWVSYGCDESPGTVLSPMGAVSGSTWAGNVYRFRDAQTGALVKEVTIPVGAMVVAVP